MTMVRLLVVLFLALILTDWPYLVNLIPFPMGIRHIFLVTIFSLFFIMGRYKALPISYLVLSLGIFTYAGFGLEYTQNGMKAYILGFAFTYLFAFVYVGAYSILISKYSIVLFLKYFVFIILVLSIPSFLTGLVQGTNLRYLPGIFRELGAWALCMNLAIVASLTVYAITAEKRYLAIALFFFACIGMTILKKSIVESIFIFSLAIYFSDVLSLRKKLIFSAIFALITSAGAVILSGELASNFAMNAEYLDAVGVDGHVRLGMYLASINIANDFFPFGSGYGTFGSLASISGGYSEIYFRYGVDVIGSNGPESVSQGAHTLLDTFWPHVIAEAGYIGACFYLALYLFPIRQAIKLCHVDRSLVPYAFYIVCSLLVICLDGLALYSPELPLFIFLGPGLAGLILRCMKSSVSAERHTVS